MNDLQFQPAATEDPVAYLENDPKEGWLLVVENIYNYKAHGDMGQILGDAASAEDVAEPAGLAAVPFERNGSYPLRQTGLPITILIPEWGLLKVAEVDLANPQQPSAILQHRRVSSIARR